MNAEIAELWYAVCPLPNPLHIALEKGWLKEEFERDHIRVSFIGDLPPKHRFSHFTHKQPSLFRYGGNFPAIWAKSEISKTRLIGMTWPGMGQTLLVKRDTTIRSVKDLKNRRVSLPSVEGEFARLFDFRRATAKRGITLALEAYDLSPEEVTWVDIPVVGISADIPEKLRLEEKEKEKTGGQERAHLPQQSEMQALQRGDVDAIFSSTGREIVLERTGKARVLCNLIEQEDWRFHINNMNPVVCTVNDDLARERPDLITRWLSTIIRAGLWARRNPEEVLKIYSDTTNIPEAAILASYPIDFHLHLVPEITEIGISAITSQKQFLREQGFIKNDIDVARWVDHSFLEEAWKLI